MLGGVGPALVVKILGDATGLNSAMDDATKSTGGFGGALNKLPIGQIALVGGAAIAAGAAFWELGKAGADAVAEEKAYAEAIKQAGAATGDWVKQSDDAIAAGQALAFTDSETMASLKALTNATGDMTKSTELLATAQDVARYAGVSLEDASIAVTKAYQGNDKALAKMIPGLKKGKDGYETIANASKMAAGQAEIYAESGEASSAMLQDSFGELVEEIAKALVPAFKAIMPALQAVIKVMTTLIKAILPVLIPFIELLAKALTVVAKVLDKVADLVSWVINRLKELLRPLKDVINSIGNISLPFGIGKSSAPIGGAMQYASVHAAGAPPSTGAITFNIYGDPAVIEARVMRALRSYTSRNGIRPLLAPGRI